MEKIDYRSKSNRDENGRIKPIFSDSDFLNILTEKYQSPNEIARKINCGMSLAQKKLKKLANDNKIESIMISGRWAYRLILIDVHGKV